MRSVLVFVFLCLSLTIYSQDTLKIKGPYRLPEPIVNTEYLKTTYRYYSYSNIIKVNKSYGFTIIRDNHMRMIYRPYLNNRYLFFKF